MVRAGTLTGGTAPEEGFTDGGAGNTLTPSGSVSVTNTGSGTAHNVTPPALVTLYIIKT